MVAHLPCAWCCSIDGAVQLEGVEARRSHVLTFGSDGEASADPDALVDLLADCIDSALDAAGPLAAGIAGVAGCSLAGTLLGVDETGRPVNSTDHLRRHVWTAEAAALRSELDEAIFHQRTGTRSISSHRPAQLPIGLQRSRPESFRRVARWMTWGDAWKPPFGQGATTLSAASWSGLLHRDTTGWDLQLVAALPVTVAQLPPARPPKHARQACAEIRCALAALRDAPWFRYRRRCSG